MNVIALFILSACLLATLYAGRVELLVAASIFFAAALLSDLVNAITMGVNKFAAIRAMEVMLDGMAEGQAKEELRQQIRRAAREAGKQIGKGGPS